MTTHLVIPEGQVNPGQDLEFLYRIGQYMVEKKPDKVICLGDFADMPSLSSYDIGKKSFEGRRYNDDVAASVSAMEVLLEPLREFNTNAIRNKKRRYFPEMHLFLGNHEDRINRAVNDDPKLDGTI